MKKFLNNLFEDKRNIYLVVIIALIAALVAIIIVVQNQRADDLADYATPVERDGQTVYEVDKEASEEELAELEQRLEAESGQELQVEEAYPYTEEAQQLQIQRILEDFGSEEADPDSEPPDAELPDDLPEGVS